MDHIGWLGVYCVSVLQLRKSSVRQKTRNSGNNVKGDDNSDAHLQKASADCFGRGKNKINKIYPSLGEFKIVNSVCDETWKVKQNFSTEDTEKISDIKTISVFYQTMTYEFWQ